MPWGGVLVGKGKQVVVAADEVAQVLRVDGPSGETDEVAEVAVRVVGPRGVAGKVCGESLWCVEFFFFAQTATGARHTQQF